MTAMGIIFANLYDSSLGDLTNKRTLASLPFGGRYRQIDFALSNMANSGIRRIGIMSRYNYQSLINHIGSGEEWDLELQESGLQFVTPYSMSSSSSYRGKIEALYEAMDHLEYGDADEYVVLADAGVLYNLDLNVVLENHIASGKDITIVTKAGVANGKKQFDLAIRLDEKGEINDMAVDYVAGPEYLASMNLFVISKALLLHYVRELVARSLYRFERDFILRSYQKGELSVNVAQFDGLVMYNESTEEYFRNNLALVDPEVRNQLFRRKHPIYTKVRDRVPTYYGENCEIDNCIVADGCMLEGAAKHSVLFRQVHIGENSTVEDSVIMNETVVGENCEIKCAILDKDVVVRPGSKLIGTPSNPIIIKRGDIV